MNLSKSLILLIALLLSICPSLGQKRVYPTQGWFPFQDSLYNANDTLKSLVSKTNPSLAFYNFTVKRGKIENIELYAQMNIRKQTDLIFKKALQAQNWKHLGKNTKGQVYQFVFWYGKYKSVDSAQNTDSTQKNLGPVESVSQEEKVLSKDRMATYPGGESAFINLIVDQFNYPTRCRDKGISGYVILRFKVRGDGSIVDLKPIEETAACPEFAKEAIRVIKLSEPWLPAVEDGMYISAYRKLPIRLDVK